jgi:putative ABC transport system substrate-binding protein
MLRRSIVLGIVVTLAVPVIPVAASAQSSRRVARVGVLSAGSASDARVDEFRQGLRELGYVEGQNVAITYRWADGHQDRLPELAAQLVASQVDVILAMGPSAWAAKRQTSTIPIVIAFSGDPVGAGIVSNLARPGTNITGLSFMSSDLAAKRLELLKQAFPRIARIAVLNNPLEPSTGPEMRETEAGARSLGVTLQSLEARQSEDLERLFAAATRERADALIVFAHGFALQNSGRIIALASRHGLPTMYGYRELVDAGGLLSYGPNVLALVRRSASYVDRIIKGAKAGDLPIEQPTRLELVINLKTAKSLGLTLPPSILARTDSVVE